MGSTRTWLTIFLCLGLSVVPFMAWRMSTRVPQDEELVELGGVVSHVELSRREWSVYGVWFWLEGSNTRLYYASFLGNFAEVERRLVPGAAIEALVTNDRDPEIWSLVVDGETIATCEQTRRGRATNGRVALVLAICLAFGAATQVRQLWSGSVENGA